jgi:hypothetical protein
MSQSVKLGQVHKLALKNKTPGSISTGANTLITLDDKPLNGVSFVKIECKARSVAKVTLEMYVELDAELETMFGNVTPQSITVGDQIYVLSQYHPAAILTKS